MVEKGRKKGTVRFVVKPNGGTQKAFLAGTFNEWQPQRMRKQKDGLFVVVATIPRGTHQYKFILDDNWTVDPDNNAWAMNKFGTMNSVLTVD